MTRPPRDTGGEGLAADTARAQIAEDLLLLADLLDHEPDREAVVALWARCYDGLLEARPYGPVLRDAVNRFCASLTEIPTCFDASAGDALLEDFRRFIGTREVKGGPQPSARGGPAGRKPHPGTTGPGPWGALHDASGKSDLPPEGWGVAAELRHLAYLVAADGVAAPTDTLGLYLNQHLVRSVDVFAAEVAANSGTHFYRELGALTEAYVHELEQRFDSGVMDWMHATTRETPGKTAGRTGPRGDFQAACGATDVL